MDKAFLREVKEAALATGKWEESNQYGLWIFPDGSVIDNREEGRYHGMLLDDLGLAHVPSDWHDNYHPAINTLLSWGLVRKRGGNTIQIWDESALPVVEKFLLQYNYSRIYLSIVTKGESFNGINYEDFDFSLAKAIADARRRGAVDTHAIQDEVL